MNRSPGSNGTPPRVVELLKSEVERTSQIATAAGIGICLAHVQKMLKGTTEPTTRTLQKLANYFNETFVIKIEPEVKP